MAILSPNIKKSNIKKSKDLFELTKGEIVSKRNLYDLIQFSKIRKSKYWDGPENIIGNTPQQGINWIGDYPNIKGVIIKTRPGTYKDDGWYNPSKTIYHYSFKTRNNVISRKEKANAVLIQQVKSQYPILLFTEINDSNWKFEGVFTVESIRKNYVVLKFKKTVISTKSTIKTLDKEEQKTKSSIVVKSEELFSLNEGSTITKRNMYDLIRLSKVKTSKFWFGLENIIGNTPMQGINWIGNFPKIKGVIIKTRPGNYENDGWSDVNNNEYHYSLKAKNGIISLSEKANAVLINGQKIKYPILLYTEHNKGNWYFEGTFLVESFKKTYVVLKRRYSENSIEERENAAEDPENFYGSNVILPKREKPLLAAEKLKEKFLNSFKNEKTFRHAEGNPFLITFEKKKYYVFLKNISPAYYPKYPDITRIQLPYSSHFGIISKSNIPFVVLGYNAEFDTFTGWDPSLIKIRLNQKSNVSLFTRDSFQTKIKLNDFKDHLISNGDKVIVFSIKSTPVYFKIYNNLFSIKPSNVKIIIPKNNIKKLQNKITLNEEILSINVIQKFKKDNNLIDAVVYCAEYFQNKYPEVPFNEWTKIISDIFNN